MPAKTADQIEQLFSQIRRGSWGEAYGGANGAPPSDSIHPAGWYGQHAFSSFVGQANMVPDPTLEGAAVSGVTLTTTRTQYGRWYSYYVLNSGSAPTTPTFGHTYTRADTHNPFHSAVVTLQASGFGANAANMDIYIEPEADPSFLAQSTSGPTWMVAGVKSIITNAVSGTVNVATAYLEIYNVTDATLAATSDAYDLIAASANDIFQLQANVLFNSAKTYRWRLRLHIEKPASSDGLAAVRFGEPQLHLNYTPDLLPFTPLLGRYVPFSMAESYIQTVVATDKIFPIAHLLLVSPSGGTNKTMTSTPTIVAGYGGQEIVIYNSGGSGNIVLQDRGTLANSSLYLTAATVTIAPRNTLRLIYVTGTGWVQAGNLVAVL